MTYLKLIKLRSVKDAILVRITELEYAPEGSNTILLEYLQMPTGEND